MGINLATSLFQFSVYGDEIKATHVQDRKNITVNGRSDDDDRLVLHNLRKTNGSSKDNPNIYFDGKGGTDTLEYSGNAKSVTMTVSSDPDYDFKIDGGRGSGYGSLNLSSLDVWTRDVEIFDLSSNDDTVDLSGWTGAYEVTIYAGDGDDQITGSAYDDSLYGEDGNDTIDAGDGDDFVDPGDINTGKQDTVTLGEGYDTLFLGDIGSSESTYTEITDGLSDWEKYGIDTGTSLPATIFSSSMKSVFSAWTKANPVSAVVMSVAFDVGGSALGTFLTAALGGTKGSKSKFGDQSSGIRLNDLNTTEDTIILPVTDFDIPDAKVSDDLTGRMTFELDAENGGDFMDAWLTNTQGDGTGSDNGDFTQFLTDVYLDANGSFASGYDIWGIHDIGEVNTALILGAWDSRITFSKLTQDSTGLTQIQARQGAEVLYDSLDSSVAGDVDFTAMASMLNSKLGLGDSIVIMGNVVGQSVSLSDSRNYANGNDKSDTFTITASAKDEAFYVNGNDGDDLLEIGQLHGVDINFHGGEGFDAISFANAHVWGTSSAVQSTYGLTIDLRNQSHQFVSDTTAFEADQGEHTAPDAMLWSVEGIIGSVNSDNLIGNAKGNLLMANGGGDVMLGGGGEDILISGAGDDTMTGGADDDVFTFTSGFDDDAITDFASGDTLYFDDFDNLEATLSISGSTVLVGSDTVTLAGFDATLLSVSYVANDDGTVDGYLSYDRTADPSLLSNEEATFYLASHGDLIEAYGDDLTDAKDHFETHGRNEGREIDFDAEQYLENYDDLQAAYGDDTFLAAQHFVRYGYDEGRTDSPNLTNALMSSAASASSSYSGVNDAYKVLDGNTNSINHTASGDADPWLSIALGEDALLDVIRIVNRNDGDAAQQAIVNGRLAGATVEVLDDDEVQWTSAALTSNVVQTIDLENTVGDEIRIRGNDGDYLHVAEIDIFGDFLV